MPICTDPSIFSTHPYNQRINTDHIQNLVESMKRNGFLENRPILVNSRMQVMDGRQRLHAALILKIPVVFNIFIGTEAEEIQTIKDIQISNNWNITNHIAFGCEYKDAGCLAVDEICRKYGIKYNDFCALALINSSETTQKIKNLTLGINKEKTDAKINFRLGVLNKLHSMINDSAMKNPKFASSLSFKKSVIRVTTAKDFSEDIFLHKCEMYLDKIRPKTSIIEYIRMFVAIYNTRNSEKIKLEILEKYKDNY